MYKIGTKVDFEKQIYLLCSINTLNLVMMNANKNTVIAASIIALGLFFMGLSVKSGLENSLKDERIVSVRGLSERTVPADKVVWPLVYKEVGNDLATLSNEFGLKNKIIVDYLKSKGITDEEISIASPEIIDLQAERYMSQNVIYRYNLTSVITVSSQQVDLVRNLISAQGELLDKGIAIVSGEYDTQVNYLFTGLNDLKPDMQLTGTVRNVVDFGCFVDIGVHQDGLLHISEMSDRFIKHPSELYATGDVIEVRIKAVDLQKKRISLTRKGMH